MKKVQFFTFVVALTASFFLSKVSESKISLLITAFAFQFIVAGYLSLVVHQTDLQPRIIKSAKFNDRIVGVFACFAISIILGACFGASADYIPFFASAYLLASLWAGLLLTNWKIKK